jgi:hypothetical protein
MKPGDLEIKREEERLIPPQDLLIRKYNLRSKNIGRVRNGSAFFILCFYPIPSILVGRKDERIF